MTIDSGRLEGTSQKDVIREQVRERYGRLAIVPDGGGSCCGRGLEDRIDRAQAMGYEAKDLEALPAGTNLGLSCGNPTALAALAPGEVVLDLGSGAGFDAFQASPRVGPTGRVIGVDMTPEMITRSRRAAESFRASRGLANVEFRLGEIEHLPVADGSVDVILSNCVINLSPDKPQVFREMFRALRTGGRVSVSDIALLAPLPESIRGSVEALVGCIAGAALVSEIRSMLAAAGFTGIALTPKPGSLRAMLTPDDPLYQEIVSALPAGLTIDGLVTSLDIAARKP